MLELNLMRAERLDVAAVIRETGLPMRWAEYHLQRCAGMLGGWTRGALSVPRATWDAYAARFPAGPFAPDVSLPTPRAHRPDDRVYFATVQGSRMVKIGVTENVARRHNGLQSSTAERVDFVLTIRGDRGVEQWLHARFAHLRTHHEWFWRTDEIDVYLDALRACADLDPRGPGDKGEPQ